MRYDTPDDAPPPNEPPPHRIFISVGIWAGALILAASLALMGFLQVIPGILLFFVGAIVVGFSAVAQYAARHDAKSAGR
jgi:hypothetical protein